MEKQFCRHCSERTELKGGYTCPDASKDSTDPTRCPETAETTPLYAEDVLGYIRDTESPNIDGMMRHCNTTDKMGLIMFLADLQLTGLISFTINDGDEPKNFSLTKQGIRFMDG